MRLIRSILLPCAAAAVALLALALGPAGRAAAANEYPYGQCTYYAKSVRPDVGNHWGDARLWDESARRAGFPVSDRPVVGDVVVFEAFVQGRTGWGHVGIVTLVDGDQFQVASMWGTEANGRVHVDWRHTGAGVHFIGRIAYDPVPTLIDLPR